MPSLKEINAQPATTLTRIERNHVLAILGVPRDPSNSLYARTEARFAYFDTDDSTREHNREARAILAAYDKIGERMTRIDGGSRGIKSELSADRARQALALRNLIFPTTGVQPLDDEPIPQIGISAGGGASVSFVPINYSNADDGESEYGVPDS